MKRISFAIATVVSLALFGAGCTAKQPAPRVPLNTPPKPSPQATAPAAPSTTPSANLPAIDETWKTYASASLHFGFQYPTRGSYAPTWNVTYVREGDLEMKDGCKLSNANEDQPATTIQVGNTTFCHSAFSSGAAGSLYLEDYYATKNGNQYIVITFTKKLTNSSILGCANADKNPYTAGACSLFSTTDYRAFLDQIVNTFAYKT